MAQIGKNMISSQNAMDLAKLHWFDAGADKVYSGHEGFMFEKDLSRHADLDKKWKQRIENNPQLKKEFDTTAGAYLIPTYLDPQIIDLTRRMLPFLALLKRETMVGLTANIQQLATYNTATWEAESAVMTPQDETYDRSVYTAAYGYSIGQVTGQMIAAGRTYYNALQESIRVHGIALRRLEEQYALLGSATATPGDPCVDDADAFDGIFKIVREVTGTHGNENDLAGAASIQLSDVRDAIEISKTNSGNPSLIVCDNATYFSLKNAISDWERHVNPGEKIAWGFTTYTIDGVPVVPTLTIPTTTTARALAVLDMDVLCYKVLQDITYEPLAKTTDADKFMIKVYEVFCDKSGGKFHSTIVGGV